MGDCSSAVDSTISFLKKISSRMFFAWSFSCTIGFFSRRLLFAFTIASLFQHLLIVGCLLPCRTKWLPRRFAPMKESIDYEDSIIFFTQNTPFFFFFGLDSSIPKQNGGRHLEVGQGSTSHRHILNFSVWHPAFNDAWLFLVHRPTFLPF